MPGCGAPRPVSAIRIARTRRPGALDDLGAVAPDAGGVVVEVGPTRERAPPAPAQTAGRCGFLGLGSCMSTILNSSRRPGRQFLANTPVIFDSGVRSGDHIVRALALGTTAVAFGGHSFVVSVTMPAFRVRDLPGAFLGIRAGRAGRWYRLDRDVRRAFVRLWARRSPSASGTPAPGAAWRARDSRHRTGHQGRVRKVARDPARKSARARCPQRSCAAYGRPSVIWRSQIGP